MSQEEQLDKTKKVIRSLLISAKQGLYSIQLERDYKFSEGKPLPYLEFGHTTLESFLMCIPDVVKITRKGRMLHLTGVPTDETSHIARLVQLQTGGTTSITGSTDLSRSNKNRQKLFMSNTPHKPRGPGRVPNDICRHVREILLSYPNGIEVINFPNAYLKRFGHALQLMRLGYGSIHSFFRAVPGVTTVYINSREYVIYSTTVARTKSPPYEMAPPGFSSSDISQQHTSYPTHPYTASLEIFPSSYNTLPTLEESHLPTVDPPMGDQVNELSEDPLPPDNDAVPPIPDCNTEPSADDNPATVEGDIKESPLPAAEEVSPVPNQSPPSTPGTSVSRTLPLLPHTASCRKPLNQAAQLAMHKQKQGQNMYDKLSHEISDLLSDLPEFTPLEELEMAYKTRYGFELSYQEFGFSSPRELVESLWNTCQLEQRDNGVFVRSLDKNRVQTTDHIALEDYSYGCPTVDADIGKRVRNLLLKWPSGMPISLILEKYRDTYGEDLPVSDFGFEDVLYMMLAIPDCVRLTPWSPVSGKTDYILHGLPLTNEELEGQVLPPPAKAAPCDDVTYGKQSVPQSWEFNVYLPFISNPDRFWIQVVGPKTTSATEIMLEKMTRFYNNLAASDLPDYLLTSPREGQSCAAPYQQDGYYYRAKIIKFPLPDQAEVYYVDYGNKFKVQLSSLRRIDICNLILPAQAIRCRLANVRPVDNERWPPGSAHKMKEYTNNLELLCKVQNIEPDDTLSVHLYDPNSDCGQSINQALIACGIAIHEDNNAPLHPGRACISPEENSLMTSYAHPVAPPPPLPPHLPHFFPPQEMYPPLLPPYPLPYTQHPGMMPQPHPYPGIPYYGIPPPINTAQPYMNSMLPSYIPNHPHHYMPPYTQPQPHPVPPAPAYDRNYLPVSAPPPLPPPPPAISTRPLLNFQPSSGNNIANNVTKPVSLPDSSTLLQGGDTYIFNDTDNQALEKLVKGSPPVLEKNSEFDLPPDMGPYEKVQKYLSTSKTPNELATQIQTDRIKLDKLKKSRGELVTKKFDTSDNTEFNRYISELTQFSSEIEQLETKITEMLMQSGPDSPSPDLAPTVQNLSSPLLTQSLTPPLRSLSLSQLPTPHTGLLQNIDAHGQKIQFKYKGIGRGGKMSDLV